MKIISAVLLTFLILLQVSCSSDEAKTQETNKPVGQKPPGMQMDSSGFNDPNLSAIPVEVTPVTRGNISSYLLYNSTLETEQMSDVFSRIPGLVEKLYVEEGKQVRKDQPLLQIEKDEYVLAEEKARLEYDKQMSEFNRFKALREKNLISDEEFENARLSLRQAELQRKQAQLNLDYTTVKSPINGVVGERLVRLGDRIQTSTRLFVVSNLSEKVVKIFVPQDELPKCHVGQAAEVTSDVLPDIKFSGWVKRLSPIVDPTSGTFKVTVGVKDPSNRLHPGMFVGVKLIVDEHRNTPLLPKPALVYENERTYFYVVQGDSVQKLALKKGFEDAEKVEVLNPLPEPARVVVIGQSGLKDRSRIKIIENRYYPWQDVLDRNSVAVGTGKESEEE